MKAALRNDFHGTSCTVEIGVLSSRQAARVRKALCGIRGCTCGGELSERGKQSVRVELTGQWAGRRPEVRVAEKTADESKMGY